MATTKKGGPEKKVGISYWSKDKVACPVCKKAFEREVMRSGNGRMIAGGLTEELHRIYEPSAKFGRIYPLIYEIGVCPNCHTAFFWNDFTEKIDPDDADKLFEHSEKRHKACEEIFPYYNLKHERTLYDGTAMYYLALMTYDDMGPYALPTMKKAILSLKCLIKKRAVPIKALFRSRHLYRWWMCILPLTHLVRHMMNMKLFKVILHRC